MKLVMRYGLAALLIVVAIILLVPPFAGSLIEQWSESDVKSRSVLAFNSSLDEFTSLLDDRNAKGIVALFEKMAQDEELLAVGFCDDQGALLYKTKEMPKSFTCKEATLRKAPTFSTVRLGASAISAVELSDRADRRTRPCRAGARSRAGRTARRRGAGLDHRRPHRRGVSCRRLRRAGRGITGAPLGAVVAARYRRRPARRQRRDRRARSSRHSPGSSGICCATSS